MNIYNNKIKNISGKEINFEDYKGKVLLIVNTASKCGFTGQYADLEALYQKYKNQGLEVLGFPSNQFREQDPGDNAEILEFCQKNYGVSFTLFEKTNVRGEEAHPLFKYLSENAPFEGYEKGHEKADNLYAYIMKNVPHFMDGNDIKWNFTKFLVDITGEVAKRYESYITPQEIYADIETLLQK